MAILFSEKGTSEKGTEGINFRRIEGLRQSKGVRSSFVACYSRLPLRWML